MKGAVKKLKAFQLTRSIMRHLLNMTFCVKQRPKMLVLLNIRKIYLFNLAKKTLEKNTLLAKHTSFELTQTR